MKPLILEFTEKMLGIKIKKPSKRRVDF